MEPVLEVKNIKVSVKEEDGNDLTIVNGVSFTINKGETVGIVGESGCGKSMTSLSIMGLLPNSVNISSGNVKLNGKELTNLSKRGLRSLRGKEMAMIFQEPMTSLNPVFTIGNQIIEMVRNHNKISKKEARKQALNILKLVGIPRADEVIDEYPHQLSGGMRQRVMIAIAMSCNPGLLIADEPTTALDVTIQAQILELMKTLQSERDMSIMLITHDLGVVAEMCDRIVVMYAGEVVEEGRVEELFENPTHPYTKGLLGSLPILEETVEYLSTIPGTVPSPSNMPKGCRFAPRCSEALDKCSLVAPPVMTLENGTRSRCWLHEEKEVVEGGV